MPKTLTINEKTEKYVLILVLFVKNTLKKVKRQVTN